MKPAKFKMTELGPIPSDWEVKRLGEIANIQLGKMIDEEKNVGVEKSYLSNRDVHWGQIDVSQLHKVKMTDADLVKYDLKDGDLLVCEGGEVGRAAIWHAPIQDCYFQKTLHRVRLNEKVGLLTAFLLAILHRYADVGFFDAYVAKTSIAHLPKDKFELLPIPLPPLPEQRRIAAALSDVDELIGALGKLVEKKRAIKTGAMQRLLTGQTRLPGFGGAEFKQTELGPIPSDWEVKRLGDCGTFIGGGTPSTAVLSYWGGDIDWYTPAEIGNTKYVSASNRRITRDGLKNCAARLLPVGTILLTTRASIGLRAILKREAATNQGFQSMIVTEAFDSEFMYYNLSTVVDEMESRASGSTFLEISSSKMGEIPIVVPPLPEQRAIAAVLSDMDAEIAALEAEKRKVEAIKQGMMQELLTGKVRLESLSEQDRDLGDVKKEV